MSKIAIIADIHANLPALKAVLREVAEAGAGRVVCGGDIVGYGAQPRECVELLRRIGCRSVLGNHEALALAAARGDRRVLGAREWRENPVLAGIAHAVRELTAEQLGWLGSFEWLLPLPGALLAHAALHEPDEWNYLHDRRAAMPTLHLLRECGVGVGFFGHTHRQDVFPDRGAPALPERLDATRVHLPEGACCAVVVGSVGQPRCLHDRRAAWAVWDPEERVVEFRRTVYPTGEAARAILAAGLPEISAVRLLDCAQNTVNAMTRMAPRAIRKA